MQRESARATAVMDRAVRRARSNLAHSTFRDGRVSGIPLAPPSPAESRLKFFFSVPDGGPDSGLRRYGCRPSTAMSSRHSRLERPLFP